MSKEIDNIHMKKAVIGETVELATISFKVENSIKGAPMNFDLPRWVRMQEPWLKVENVEMLSRGVCGVKSPGVGLRQSLKRKLERGEDASSED